MGNKGSSKKKELKKITPEELASHNTGSDCWICINGKVVDCTAYLAEHPGGSAVLKKWAGKDATEAFEKVGHSEMAIENVSELAIGALVTNLQTAKCDLDDQKSS
mmetsp:Transcript_11414/g.17067  ORF Transcript_11414/g.17067 Transcript_11414/m.17067 type:complete len:105 (+) Transcript_11414:61-375(+)